MESHASTARKAYLVTTLIVSLIGELEAWENNAFLQLHDKIANAMNWSDCWICSRLPTNIGQGHPVVATSFPNSSQIVKAFSNMPLTEYTEIPKRNLEWQIDLSTLWNETTEVPCVQRCYLENTTKNMGGNSTDKKCGSTSFVGAYPNCTSYIKYGGANMWNSNQTRRHVSSTPKGWPTPVGQGWYWICGKWGYKVLPLGWKGQCAIGTIVPNITIVQNLTSSGTLGLLRTYMKPVAHPTRGKRNPLVKRPTSFHSFARWFIPWLGVSELEKALVNISATMEIINNATADALTALQKEISSLEQVTLQNRLGLDLLFAKEGGLCTVIGEHCCTYVNQDKRIEKDLFQIWEKTKILHEVAQDNTSWGFSDLVERLTSWLPNLTWLKQLFVTTITVMILLIALCVVVRCALGCCQNTGNSYSEWKKYQLRQRLESNKYFEKVLDKESLY